MRRPRNFGTCGRVDFIWTFCLHEAGGVMSRSSLVRTGQDSRTAIFTAEQVFKSVDTVLAIGVRYSEVSTGFYSDPEHCPLIHVDANPDNLGRIMKTQVSVNADAGLFLDRLLGGAAPALRDAMSRRHAVGGPMPGRPWKTLGYGLGLFIDPESLRGRCLGHTGEGPGSVAAAYHFPDLDPTLTVMRYVHAGSRLSWSVCQFAR